MPDENDRADAMLTQGQRKFLKNNGKGLSRQSQYEYREAIKERVRNTIRDFELLFEYWDESEREEVFKDTASGELFDGLASFIALLYEENRFESGMQALLFRGINKAEHDMAESDLNLVQVDLSVEPVGTAKYEEVLEKFRRRRFDDMSNNEAQAIIRLLSRSRAVTYDDLEEMRRDLVDKMNEIKEEHGEGRARRQKYAREKQLAHRESNDEE